MPAAASRNEPQRRGLPRDEARPRAVAQYFDDQETRPLLRGQAPSELFIGNTVEPFEEPYVERVTPVPTSDTQPRRERAREQRMPARTPPASPDASSSRRRVDSGARHLDAETLGVSALQEPIARELPPEYRAHRSAQRIEARPAAPERRRSEQRPAETRPAEKRGRGPERTVPDAGLYGGIEQDPDGLETTFAQPKEPQIERLASQMRARYGEGSQGFSDALSAVWADPSSNEAAARLEQEARRMGCFRELVEAFSMLVAAEENDQRALRLAERGVDWCRHELGDSARAQPFLDRIGMVDPSHPAVHRRLASVYREHGVFDAERDSLQRALSRARNGGEKRQILFRLAAVEEERFQNLEEAGHHYDAILAIDSEDIEALRGLERIARIERRFTKLTMVLEREVDVARDPHEKLSALLRLADLHEHYFLRPHLAAPRLEAALVIDGKNRAALEGLERCYRAARDWDGLANALERLAETENDARTAVAALMRLAEVHEDKRHDLDAAAGAHRRVLGYDPVQREALTALARIHERRREWNASATYKAHLAELAPTSNAAAQLHASIGDMLAPDDRDPDLALRHYEQAVSLDPSLAAAWEALLRLADRGGDRTRIVHYLTKRAERAPSNRARAQAYVELARFLEHSLQDGAAALAAYEFAVQADVSNEAAAAALLDELARQERWDDVLRLVDPLVAAAARIGDARRAYRLVAIATQAAFATGDGTKALRYALKAWELRPQDGPVGRAVVDVCHRLRADLRAIAPAKNALRAIATGELNLTATGFVKLAEVQLALGEAKGALGSYGRALGIDGKHAQALTGIGDLYVARGDYARAAETKQKLARATTDTEEKFRLAVEAAELWSSRVKNTDKATVALEEAREIKPRDPWVLHTLVGVYGDRSQWHKLAGTLRALAEVEETNERRTKTLYALAKLTWKKLREPKNAAQIFEEVLDLDPRHETAFSRVVSICEDLNDPRALAGAYRRMILRLRDLSGPEVDEVKYTLFHELACLLRDRLQQPKGALEAFAVASQLKPDADEDRRQIAELLVSLGDVPKATETTKERVRRCPLAPDAYRELAELYSQQNEYDRASTVLDVLGHLSGLDEAQAAFLADYPPMPLAEVPGTLAGVAWRSHILHPKLDPWLTVVLRVIAAAVRRARAATFTAEKQAALGAPLSVGFSPMGDRVVAAFQHASEILGLPTPLLYAKKGMSAPIVAVPAHVPALFVALDTIEGLPPDVIPFFAAKHLAEMRPELSARAFFRTATELKALLATGFRIATGNDGKPLRPSDSAVQLAMSAEERAELRTAVMTLEARGGSVDLAAWLAYADVSSTRAGLLLAGSVDVAWRGLLRVGMAPSDLPPAERRAEILSFAISDEYAELRDAIGVGVHQRTDG